MSVHQIPPDAGLIELIHLNTKWSIEDACAARKAKRHIGQRLYRERAAKAHRERMAAATAFEGGVR